MTVTRIVPNLTVSSVETARALYGAVLGLEVAMDHGWIATVVAPSDPRVQLSLATHDATAPVVPAISVQVDDLDAVHGRVVAAGLEIVHPVTVETWGVRRFFFRDPDGNVVNVLSHDGAEKRW